MDLAVNKLATHDVSDEDIQKIKEDLYNPALHLYLRTRTQIMKIMMDTMLRHNFVHPPVYMMSSMTDPLNHDTYPAKIDYYGTEYSLNQSLIFHKMLLASVSQSSNVFWFSPNIRLEDSDNGDKYATEFTQMDFEAFAWKNEDAIDLVHEILWEVIKEVSPTKDINLKLLRNIKREAYDRLCPIRGKYLNFDFEINGVEVCSGAEREFTYDELTRRMQELNYPLEYFKPILKFAHAKDLKQTAGAGIGIERLVAAIFQVPLHEVYPFKRIPKKKIIF